MLFTPENGLETIYLNIYIINNLNKKNLFTIKYLIDVINGIQNKTFYTSLTHFIQNLKMSI